MRSRWLIAAATILVTTAPGARAQDSSEARPPEARASEPPTNTGLPWGSSYFPWITKVVNDGPALEFLYEYRQPADYFDKVMLTKGVRASALAAWHGTFQGMVEFDAPRLAPGWRLIAQAYGAREPRLAYFGLGNDSEAQDSITDPAAYRVQRVRFGGWTEVTRRIAGPLHVALAAGIDHANFDSTFTPSAFGQDFGGSLSQTDVTGRLTLVLDTRDNEYNTQKGILAQVGGLIGSGGDGYRRVHAVASGWVEPRDGTVLALRVAGSGTWGTPPLNADYMLQTWERPLMVMGGEESHRGLLNGRLVGDDQLFVNVDVRQDILPLGDLGGVGVVGFFDAGRVFQDQPFELTFNGMKWGAGGGIVLRVLRAYITTINFAGGSEGFQFTMTQGWFF